jgi:hypothetical protein
MQVKSPERSSSNLFCFIELTYSDIITPRSQAVDNVEGSFFLNMFNYIELSTSPVVWFGSGVGVGASGYFLKGC